MKQWSKSWKASKKPKKQRKYFHNLPEHLKGKLLSSHLSKELHKKYSMRSIRARKGDKVKVMRGQNTGKTGTIEMVDTKNLKVYISGVELTKRDGSKTKQPIHPSNILIQELDLSDKRRFTTQKNKPAENKTATEKPTQSPKITKAKTPEAKK